MSTDNAVVKTEPQAPEQTATAIIQVIERAASNPDVDIEKMERLLEMQERILDRNAKAEYMAALSQMQPELPVIAEKGQILNKQGNVQSRYAKWEDINDAIKPVLARHGFTLSFRFTPAQGQTIITAVLGHQGGHSEETAIALPDDTSGSKNAVQARGSSTSYGKRYTAGALLNLTSRGEDDDGNKAGLGETITESQAADLRALMEEVGADEARFLRHVKATAVEDIKATAFNYCVQELEAKRVKANRGKR